MSSVSTHVLDTGLGLPALGVPVRLSRIADDQVAVLGEGATNADGRFSDFEAGLEPGTYQLWFDIDAYAAKSGQTIFFPEVTVTFTISDERHHHVPLLLSPFAYSTYRGS
ncbi:MULTISPECIES: hydroxyisourate hydrolase [unclassified Kribbella]|uniref:hydroxyisourate hydrolase n=1 Tax=unclassified Kribbella TaxID=2644121 RepID=UPI003409EEC0